MHQGSTPQGLKIRLQVACADAAGALNILKDNGYANMVAGQFVCVSMISCSRCSRDSAYPNEFNSHIRIIGGNEHDGWTSGRCLLNLHPAPLCNPVPTHGLGCERCRVRANEQFGGRVLHTHVLIKYFSIHQANKSSVRVRRSIRCASEATTENTPHRPPVGFAKKVTNNEYRPIKCLEKFSKEGS